MKILNVQKRIINQPPEQVWAVIETLASKSDMVWPYQKWPAIRLDRGLALGSKGGHGPIGYFISQYKPGALIQFEFTKPRGFKGMHKFEIKTYPQHKTKLEHTIDMHCNALALISWAMAIRWLHEALMQDTFDRVENHFLSDPKTTDWSLWVRILRGALN